MVEVEGVYFNIWVLEESGQRAVEDLDVRPEEGENRVVSSECSGGVDAGDGGEPDNSREDDDSEAEVDGDVGKCGQYGENVEVQYEKDKCEQETIGGNILLTCEVNKYF
jgi:hypothetical protein